MITAKQARELKDQSGRIRELLDLVDTTITTAATDGKGTVDIVVRDISHIIRGVLEKVGFECKIKPTADTKIDKIQIKW